jgi:YidC/Oxa1 family membrane protein insertase
MDKKNTVLGVLLLVAAFIALQFTPKPAPPPPRAVAPTSTVGTTASAAATTTPGATSGSAISAAPAGPEVTALVQSIAKEVAGATATTLANDYIEVHFSNFGGAIRDVALKKYPAIQGKTDPFIFNGVHADPMLAFIGKPGLDRDTPFTLVSQTASEVVYRAVLNGELEVTRRYVIAPSEGKNTDPYQLRHETTFRNLSAKPTDPLHVALALGTAPPAHARDDGLQITTGYASEGKYIFVQRSDLDATGGVFGMGARTARYEIQSSGPVTWASVKNKFFTSILTPDQPASGIVSHRVKLFPELPNELPNAYGISGATVFDLPTIAPQGEAKLGMNFYVGPKEYRRLANTDVFKANQDKVMQFGKVFGFFAQLLSRLMTLFHDLLADPTSRKQWGFAIILTTLTLKIATLPLTLKASRSMKRMQKLAPEMKIIREKFKDNPQKQQVAMMELYKQHKVNPLGGCIPMLLPMPFFFGFYSMLQSTAELRFAPFLWAPDLSMPDTVGFIAGFPINILPLLLGVTMLVQMQLTPQANMDKTQAAMMKFMPLIFLVFCYNFSCALALYSTVNGIFTIGQQMIINRMKDDGDPTPAIADRMKNVTPAKKRK